MKEASRSDAVLGVEDIPIGASAGTDRAFRPEADVPGFTVFSSGSLHIVWDSVPQPVCPMRLPYYTSPSASITVLPKWRIHPLLEAAATSLSSNTETWKA